MAPGRYNLSKTQFAAEVTPGTAVSTATAFWRGPAGQWVDNLQLDMIEENNGIFGGSNRSNIPRYMANLSLPETIATFEQLPYLLAYSLGGPVTGTADGSGGTGFKYITTIPTTTAPTDRAATIQTGDDKEQTYATYGKCTEWTIAGSGGAPVTMTSSWMGRQAIRLAAFDPASPTLITVADGINFGTGALYIDDIGGTTGTTQVSNQLLGFSVTGRAMWEPKFTVEQRYYTFAHFTGYEITGELTFEHDAQVIGSGGEREDWRAQLPKLMRLQFLGPSYGTAGTGTVFTGGKKGLRFDLPIKWTKFNEISQQNNNSTVTATFSSKYDLTAATSGTITITNETSALP